LRREFGEAGVVPLIPGVRDECEASAFPKGGVIGILFFTEWSDDHDKFLEDTQRRLGPWLGLCTAVGRQPARVYSAERAVAATNDYEHFGAYDTCRLPGFAHAASVATVTTVLR
jgi:hypothetical protein